MGNISKEERKRREENEEVIIPEVVDNFPILKFSNSGWCEELNKSYRKGSYKPKSKKEHDALKKYAK